MTETLLHADIPPAKEILPASQQMLALQGRMAIEPKYLNPSVVDIPELKKDDLVDFNARDFKIYDRVSRFDRRSYWDQQVAGGKVEANFNKQYETWRSTVVSVFSDQDLLNKLKGVLGKSGFNGNQFKDADAQNLYKRYFATKSDDAMKGVKQFVADVLDSYKGNDYSDLKNNLAEVQWFSNLFGKESSEIVMQLIDSEVQMRQNPDAFVKKLNEKQGDVSLINNLEANPHEKQLLNHIWDHGEIENPSDWDYAKLEDLPIASDPLESAQPPEQSKMTEEELRNMFKLKINEKQDEIQNSLVQAYKEGRNIYLLAGTGSGKTTITPYMIYDLLKRGLIPGKCIVTQPRVITTESLADTVAQLIGYKEGRELKLGEEVGVVNSKTDLQNKNGVKTKMLFTTVGKLVRNMQTRSDDPNNPDKNRLLLDTSIVMLDEAHVPEEDLDKVLQTLLEVQKERQDKNLPELIIFTTSATAKESNLKNYLLSKGQPPLKVAVEGVKRPHDLEKIFSDHSLNEEQKPVEAAKYTVQVLKQREQAGKNKVFNGDFFYLVAGKNEITKTLNAIEEELQKAGYDLSKFNLMGLTAQSTEEERKKAQEKAPPGTINIIVATDVVETGITFPNLIDGGVFGTGNKNIFDPTSGFMRLVKQPKDQASIEQGIGRIGRKNPGTAKIFMTEQEFNALPKYPTPQIFTNDPASLILYLKKKEADTGISLDIRNAKFMSNVDGTQIPEANISAAEKTLLKLGAIDANGKITPEGRKMESAGQEYRTERMYIEAKKNDVLYQVAAALALVNVPASPFITKDKRTDKSIEESTLQRVHTIYKDPTSDFVTMWNIWKAFEANNFSKKWANDRLLDYEVLMKAWEMLTKEDPKTKKRVPIYTKSPNSYPDENERIKKSVEVGLEDMLLTLDRNHPYDGKYLKQGYSGNLPIELYGRSALRVDKSKPFPLQIYAYPRVKYDEESKYGPKIAITSAQIAA